MDCVWGGVSFKVDCDGSPSMVESGWWEHVIKADDANFESNFFSRGTLAGVDGKGIISGLGGVFVLCGHLHVVVVSTLQPFECGKESSIIPRSFMAVCDI